MGEKCEIRRPTIVDVANLSGVSKSTVSNVIRGAEHLSEATRDRVLTAIAELGYRPNAVARDLKSQRTTTLGLIVGDLRNPHYAELTGLIEQHAEKSGFATIIGETGGIPEAERRRVHLLLEHRVSGIIMLHFSGDHALVDDAVLAGVPLVGVGLNDSSFDCVAVDDEDGAALATEHLITLGHKRIAFVPSPYCEFSTNSARQRGWARALEHVGLAIPAVFPVQLGDLSNTNIVRTINSEPAPTAFLAGNDVTALQVMDLLEGVGRLVPRDASVVGIDNIAPARLRRLALTTIRQPTAELAACAMEHLLRRITAPGSAPYRPVRRLIAPELIVRGSTSPPQA